MSLTDPQTAAKKGVGGKSNTEKLVVTVIPVNEEAYAKTIQIPQSLIGKPAD